MARPSPTALAMARYAARRTSSFCFSRAARERPAIGRAVIGCAAASVSACCSRRSMLNSSSRMDLSLSQGAACDPRLKARRIAELNLGAFSARARGASGRSGTSRSAPRRMRSVYSVDSAAWRPVPHFLGRYTAAMPQLKPQQLQEISDFTLQHYNQRAEDFWEGTRDHDVSQNIQALLQHLEGDPPFTILDLG